MRASIERRKRQQMILSIRTALHQALCEKDVSGAVAEILNKTTSINNGDWTMDAGLKIPRHLRITVSE